MRVMITGCAGFIGSHLTSYILSKGFEISGIDNFDPYYDVKIKKQNISELKQNKDFHFVEGDINEINSIDEFKSQKFDLILHLAAKAGVRASFLNPEGYAYANINGTINMLEYAKSNGITKFVFASSSSVYGNSTNIPYKEDEINLKPISPYGMSKLNTENYCEMYAQNHDIEINALRFFTVYGPKQRPDMAINKFIKNMINGLEIDVYGDGETYRDYTYIDDIINGIVGSMNYFNGFQIFNLGSGNPIKLSEMIGTIGELLDIEPKLNKLPIPPGDVMGTYADVSKAKKFLIYDPKISFREGVEKEIEWIKQL